MKSVVCYSALAAVLTLALGARLQADSTSVTTPTTPTAPAAARTYPQLLPLTLEVSADEAHELSTLREFMITAHREGDYAPVIVVGPVNPFTTESACKRPMPEGIIGCVINGDATVATLRVNWHVPEAGTYRFVLAGKRGTSERVVTLGVFDLEAYD